MSVVRLTIPAAWVGRKRRYIPHSLNHRLFYMTRSNWNKAWKENVWGEVMKNRHLLAPLPIEKAQVRIILRTSKLLDVDNSYTCAKPLLDGLRYAGVLVDDSPDHVSLRVGQVRVAKLAEQGVSILISRINQKEK